MSLGQFAMNYCGDEEPRDHEEDVDTDEAASKAKNIGMVKNHG